MSDEYDTYVKISQLSVLKWPTIDILWTFQRVANWQMVPFQGVYSWKGSHNPILWGQQLTIWLVVSTHLKNINQNRNLPQIEVKTKNIWNHHRHGYEPPKSVLGMIPSKQQFGKTGLPRLQPQILGALLHSIQDSGCLELHQWTSGFTPLRKTNEWSWNIHHEWRWIRRISYIEHGDFPMSC